MTDYLMIGEILKPQGIKGEAKVKPYASNLSDFLRWDTLYFLNDGSYTPVKAVCSRVADGFAYVTLGDCSDPDDVEHIRGKQLFIDRAHACPLNEDTVYIADMIGVGLIDENGECVGTLTDVLQNGPVDVYVFSTPHGTMMAPALRTVFPDLDIVHKTLTVNSKRLGEVAVFED